MSDALEVVEFFSELPGKKCWSVIGGLGAGTVISLGFGAKIPARRPLRNPRLTLDERKFEGEKSVIFYCDWRLEDSTRILSSSQNISGDQIDIDALAVIKNRSVLSIAFTSRMHDLRIDFEGELSLQAFCDISVGNENDSNYVLFNKNSSVAVTPAGRIVVEAR